MENIDELLLIEKLDKQDKEKVKYFLKLLLEQKKYNNLKKEISRRRKEISTGKILSHDEIWNKLDV